MFSYDNFIAIFPEFSGIPKDRVSFVYEFGKDFLNEQAFGKWYDRAVMLYLAHRLATQYNIDATVTSEGMVSPNEFGMMGSSKSASTSSLSESKTPSVFANSDNPLYFDLSKTRYGMMLLELIDLLMPGGYVVYGRPNFFNSVDPRLGPGWNGVYVAGNT